MSDEQRNSNKSNKSLLRAMGLVSALGIDFVVCLMGGYYLGIYFGRMLGSELAGSLVGLLTGMAVGIITIIYIIRSVLGDDNG